MPRKTPGPPCQVCGLPSAARNLCPKHLKRWQRHGHTDQTRPADWGSREKHPLYKLWNGMIRRCHEAGHKDFHNYGARGIEVCREWREDFWQFVNDMGPRPSSEHQIERKENDGPYAAWNCKWATVLEQARNRRTTMLTAELAAEIKKRHRNGELTGDISKSLRIDYDLVRNVVVGAAWRDV